MSHTLYIVVIVAITAIFVLALEILERRRLRRFLARGDTLTAWLQRFPSATSDEIAAFLSLFAEAFCFRSKQANRFDPSDRIADIYRARHPCYLNLADAMELETFALALKDEYGIDLTPHWHEHITLGEIFEMTQRLATDRLQTA